MITGFALPTSAVEIGEIVDYHWLGEYENGSVWISR
jgi:hypothetical protein